MLAKRRPIGLLQRPATVSQTPTHSMGPEPRRHDLDMRPSTIDIAGSRDGRDAYFAVAAAADSKPSNVRHPTGARHWGSGAYCATAIGCAPMRAHRCARGRRRSGRARAVRCARPHCGKIMPSPQSRQHRGRRRHAGRIVLNATNGCGGDRLGDGVGGSSRTGHRVFEGWGKITSSRHGRPDRGELGGRKPHGGADGAAHRAGAAPPMTVLAIVKLLAPRSASSCGDERGVAAQVVRRIERKVPSASGTRGGRSARSA